MKRSYGTLSDPNPPPPTRLDRLTATIARHVWPCLALAFACGFSAGLLLATGWLTSH